jgi:site-specific DNA-methyltransferase (adenine-specific)
MITANYNPDVLSCLANLSNDEVFTPPSLANEMLDLLPKSIWNDKEAKFLDPFTKSGVFLREIAKRLMIGLEHDIPDTQKRIDHILKNQVYGIAITELTSLLSRRSVYCSKTANGNYSICPTFDNEQGNIIHAATKHTWKLEKCKYCGASKKEYDRGNALETYAYQFIHTDKPHKIFNMKFDVIIGNPPYQLSDGGFGASAKPIYHKFVEQAKRLNPKYLSMIIPARWFAGGRVGELSDFRAEMLKDERIRVLHDFANASDCFPGVEIKGGVNYFLWDRDNKGKCNIYSHDGASVTKSERHLLEQGSETFIRRNEAIPILRKVLDKKEESFSSIVSANDPFGFDIREENSMKRIKPQYRHTKFENSVHFYYNGWRKDGVGYIDKKHIKKNADLLFKYKFFVPKAVGSGDSKTDVIKPVFPKLNSCCSETYIVIGPFDSEQAMTNAAKYLNTKFFHFLVSLKKITQEARRGVYQFVPIQDFSESWTDQKLYKKYDLIESEIAFIESMTRPMEASDE